MSPLLAAILMPLSSLVTTSMAARCEGWGTASRRTSHENFPHHLTVHIREPEVAPLEAEGQPLVVEAELMQDRGVEIVDVDGALDDLVAEVVAAPWILPALKPPPATHMVKASM